jgi:hypothetical protein
MMASGCPEVTEILLMAMEVHGKYGSSGKFVGHSS